MLQIISSIIPIVVSIAVVVIAFLGYRISKISIVKEYFAQGDSIEHKKFRKQIYDIYNKPSDDVTILKELKEITSSVAHVVSFYDFWALMVQKSYLPLWTFEGMPGKVAIDIFEKIKPYIAYRRESENKREYALRFEQLISKIKKL